MFSFIYLGRSHFVPTIKRFYFNKQFPLNPFDYFCLRLAPPFGDEAPPPSYEEAVGKTERLANARNDEDYVIDDQFVPSYPFFNLSVDVPPGSRH